MSADDRVGLVIAADIQRSELLPLLNDTCFVAGVTGIKIGKSLAMMNELPEVVSFARDNIPPEVKIIYDGQKEATDTPQTGQDFANDCATSGINTAIIFPFAGPTTQETYTKALQDKGIQVITGMHLTVPRFLVSEGGYMADDAPIRAFTLAVELGVTDFVLPGNKLTAAQQYIHLLDNLLGKGNWTGYAPGFLTQGGELTDFAHVMADRPANAIVGSAIYQALDMRLATEQIVQQLRQQ